MWIRTTNNGEEIIGLLEPLLAADPVRNTVLGSVVAGLRGEDADGWCAHPVGNPGVLAMRSQLHTPIVLTSGWNQFDGLAEQVAALACVSAIGGPDPEVSALSTALTERGMTMRLRVRERLHRLDELADGIEVAGSARLATRTDVELLASWFEAFTVEAFGALPAGFDAARVAEQSVRRSRPWLWTDSGGDPRSMAVGRSPAHGVARIGPVYTPPGQRGHGYGSAVTAAATQDVLAADAIPVLYTDLANPTSNKIYRRLGYYPVEDRLHVEFD